MTSKTHQLSQISSPDPNKSIFQDAITENNRESPIPIRINAENLSPRKYVIIIIFYCVLWICLTIFTFLIDVQSTVLKTNKTELGSIYGAQCDNPCSFIEEALVCQKFGKMNPKLGLIMRGLTPFHQFALIKLEGEDETLSKLNNTRVGISLYSLQFLKKEENGHEYGMFKKKIEINEKQVNLTISSFIGIYRHFSFKDYLFVMQILEPAIIQTLSDLPILSAQLINPTATLLNLITKTALFLLILATTIIYLIFYIKQQSSKRILQQKLVLYISFSTLLFNNPFYIFSILDESIEWFVIDMIFMGQSVCIWMLFIVYLNLRDSSGSKNYAVKYTMPMKYKIVFGVFAVVFFGVLVAFYSEMTTQQFNSEQFFISAFEIEPALSSIMIALFANWVIFVILVKVWACLNFQCFRNRTIETVLTICIMLTLLRVFINFFLQYSQNAPLLMTIFTSFLFNFNCILIQYLFTNSESSCFFSNSISNSNLNKFVKIQNEVSDSNQELDEVDLGQISRVSSVRYYKE